MTSPIEFWFDFSSPYGYFAAFTIEDRLRRFGRPIVWRPFLLGVAYQVTGMEALARTPLRRGYANRDSARIATTLRLPFCLPPFHPYRSQSPARTFYWLEENEPRLAVPFAKAAFQEHFQHGRDITAPEASLALVRNLGLRPDRLRAWLSSDAAKQLLRSWTTQAIDKGVFGSPFFIADGEPFWGWDRLPLLEGWLAHREWGPAVLENFCRPRSA